MKGYETYATAFESRAAAATALQSATPDKDGEKTPGYHASNVMIDTPEEVYRRIKPAQEACSFSELTIVPHFGTMPLEEAQDSVRLFGLVHHLAADRATAAARPGQRRLRPRRGRTRRQHRPDRTRARHRLCLPQ